MPPIPTGRGIRGLSAPPAHEASMQDADRSMRKQPPGTLCRAGMKCPRGTSDCAGHHRRPGGTADCAGHHRRPGGTSDCAGHHRRPGGTSDCAGHHRLPGGTADCAGHHRRPGGTADCAGHHRRPAGTVHSSPGRSPGLTVSPQGSASCRDASCTADSLPHISLVILHTVFFQEVPVFLLETLDPVMFLLLVNVDC